MEAAREKLGKELLKKEVRSLSTLLLNCARIAFAVLLLVLADRVAAGRVSSDTAIAVGGLAAAALAVLLLSPRMATSLAQRVSKFSAGPFAFEVFEAAEKKTPADPTEDPESRDASVTSVLDLRLKIERKLTYVAKHVLDDEAGHPTFLTVGSLKYDKLLSAEEADIVNKLMTMRSEDLDGLPAAEKDEFLDAADRIARNIRASVLHGFVWQQLKQLEENGDWKVRKIRRGSGRRADLVAEKSRRKYLIAPVFAIDEESELLQGVEKRLRLKIDEDDTYARGIVVLPHRSESPFRLKGNPTVIGTDLVEEYLTALDESAPAPEAPEQTKEGDNAGRSE